MRSVIKHLAISFITINAVIAHAATPPKPNILWITIEDTSPQFIGCYGNGDAKTPNIDKLAGKGVRFTNAFSTGTVCSPSRTTLITGVNTYQLGTGHHRSEVPIPSYIKGFPFYLKQEGYYTSNNAKTDYNLAGADAFVREAWDESSGMAGWWKRKPNQPFFAVFNYMDSHQSRTMTWTYDMYKKEVYDKLQSPETISDDGFKMPPIYHESPEMRKEFARVYNSLKLTDNKIGLLLARLEKDHLTDSTIIFFFADHGEGMPRGKTNGIDYGYRVPFVIWFPPIYKDLSPWGKEGVVTDELIDFEDLAPTILSLAGGIVPAHMKGRVLAGKHRAPALKQLYLSNDRSDNGPDLSRTLTDGRFSYSRNFMAFEPELRNIRYMEIGPIKQQMRRDLAEGKLNEFQKSLFQPRDAETLYDLQNDPWQMHNLAFDASHKTQLAELSAQLKKQVLSKRDVLFLPEYKTKFISISTSLYEFRQSEKDFPLGEIYNAAELAGFKGIETAKKQSALLKNRNEDVRYWSVIGLKAQPAEVLSKFKGEIISAIDDSYPPVAITAASIAYEAFGFEDAKEKLQRYCMDKNQDLALMAINYLIYSKDARPFIETVKKVKATRGMGYDLEAACNNFLSMFGLVPNDFSYDNQKP